MIIQQNIYNYYAYYYNGAVHNICTYKPCCWFTVVTYKCFMALSFYDLFVFTSHSQLNALTLNAIPFFFRVDLMSLTSFAITYMVAISQLLIQGNIMFYAQVHVYNLDYRYIAEMNSLYILECLNHLNPFHVHLNAFHGGQVLC